MKIGVLIDRLNVGGVEKIAIEEVRALRGIGHDAYLVILRRKGVVNDAFVDLRKDLPTLYLDDRLPGILKFSFKFPLFYFFSSFHLTYPFFIPVIVKKKEFDYFIVHGTYTAFTAITIMKWRRIKFSTYIWDPIEYILSRVYSKKLSFFLFLFKKVAYLLDKSIISNSDTILVGGNVHNNYFKRLSPKVKIKVIPPSTNPLINIPPSKKAYVLMVTAWKKGKYPEYILEIIKEIPNIKIKMVGKWLDDIYMKEFQQLLIKCKATKNVEIVGGVSEVELSNYYTNALVLLQTNDDRGFGMPALEAAAHGTTFIIPEGQGVCNLFSDTIDGFYTKEKDTQAIVKYIKDFMNNIPLARSMGMHAWNVVKEKHSWEKHAQQLVSLVK